MQRRYSERAYPYLVGANREKKGLFDSLDVYGKVADSQNVKLEYNGVLRRPIRRGWGRKNGRFFHFPIIEK